LGPLVPVEEGPGYVHCVAQHGEFLRSPRILEVPLTKWWSALGRFDEPEYVVVAIAVIGLLISLIIVLVRAPGAGSVAAITTAIATLAGHALGGAGKRQVERRATTAEQQASGHEFALRHVEKELEKATPDIDAVRSIVSDALNTASPASPSTSGPLPLP
jgi:hypothetical protein